MKLRDGVESNCSWRRLLSLSLSLSRKPVIYIILVLLIFGAFFSTFNLIPQAEKAKAAGTTYYVDATSGLDSNIGTDISYPWKTINKVNNTASNPGDSILFKRGETWREELKPFSSGTLGNQITFGAYGSGSLPIINGADIVSGPWTDTGGNIYTAAVTTQPYIAVFDGTKGTLKANVGALTSDKDWYWAANVLSIYSLTNPAGRVIEAGVRHTNISYSNYRNYITVDSIHTLYANNRGIYIRGTNWVVQNCIIEYVEGDGYGVLAFANGAVIQDNTVQHIRKYGIVVSTAVTSTVVQNNTVSDVWDGLAYPGGNGVGIWLLGADTIVSGNKTTECLYGISSVGSTNNLVINNLVIDSKVNGINHATGVAGSPISIIGNTVIHNPDYPAGHGIVAQSAGDGFIMKNNLIYGTYTGVATNVQLVAIGSATYTSVDIDYNLYYLAPGSTSYVGQLAGSMYSTLGTWQSALATTTYSGKDVHAVSSDPKFVNPATDFHLQPTSPAIDAGVDLNINTDYDGKQRYDMPGVANTGNSGSFSKNYVDIGAFEYVTPPTPRLISSTHPVEGATYLSHDVNIEVEYTSSTTRYYCLLDQNPSPTMSAVLAGVYNTTGQFNVNIPEDGQWYLHVVAINLDGDPSAAYGTYSIKVGIISALPATGSTLPINKLF